MGHQQQQQSQPHGDPNVAWKFAQCFGDKGDVEDITEGRFATGQTFGNGY